MSNDTMDASSSHEMLAWIRAQLADLDHSIDVLQQIEKLPRSTRSKIVTNLKAEVAEIRKGVDALAGTLGD